MFKEILRLLLKARMLSKSQLAHEVGVSEGSLQDIINLLVAAGYLSATSPEFCEPSACGSCAHGSQCSTDAPSVFYYSITPKGMEYANA